MNDKLQKIIAEAVRAQPEDITPQTRAEDCEGWDSLAQVLMISKVMDEFNVEIPFTKMSEIDCVQDFIDILGE